MKFSPLNISHLDRRRLVPLPALLIFFALASCATTVKKAEEMFTPSLESEIEMGREFAEKASEELDLIQDPDLIEYITLVGQPIVDAAGPMPYRFRFHIVNNASLNAFAVPGGHIYLFSGLLLKARNVQEVAGVMAHELAHVKHRHSAEMMGKGTLVNLASLAAMILAGAAGAGQAGTVGAMGAGQALQLSFSREFEREADRYGLFYLYEAGYDPHGLLDFFETMIREQRFSTDQIPPYLLTHPISEERLGNAESQIRINRLSVRKPREVPNFYRFQGLLQAEVSSPAQLVSLLKERLAENPDDPKQWYQLGLVYVRQGWSQEALVAFQTALELDSQLYSAWVDLGHLQTRMGRWLEAEAAFDQALQLHPDYPEAYQGLGRIYLLLGDPWQAAGLLEDALSLRPGLISIHKDLASVHKEMGDEGGFHEQMAAYFDKLDRPQEALKHLKQALEIYGDGSEDGRRVEKAMEAIQS